MEQRLLQKVCPGKPIRRIGCNGDDVAIDRMCDFIETQVRLLGNRHHPIFVIFDREKRVQAVEDIEQAVLSTLRGRGLGAQDIRVFVSDREAEDWLLKDIDTICRIYNLPVPQVLPRGKGGLARLIKPKVDYNETTTGVELFLAVSKAVISDRDAVFRRLRDSAVEVGCAFFDQGLL